jgi:hypothetical protein
MKVSLEQKALNYTEKGKGFFAKPTPRIAYQVLLTVDFSEEELSIIRTRDFGEMSIYESPPHYYDGIDTPFTLVRVTVNKLINERPYLRGFDTVLEAKQWAEALQEELLPNLKRYLVVSAEVATGTTSFEL